MPRSLAHLINPIAKQAIGKDWAHYATLLERWQEIVGADYAKVSTPIKISFPHQPNEPRRKDGTLTIRIPKGLAMEFTYKVEAIRQRINNYFGYEAFRKVALDAIPLMQRQKNVKKTLSEAEKSALKKTLEGVDDPELQTALEKLGTQIFTKSEDQKGA